MARSPEGAWSLRRDPRTRIFTVRFRHQGRRYHLSTRETDPRQAQAVAGRLYAEAVSGRRRPFLGVSRDPLDELLSLWLATVEPELDERTTATYEDYAAAHWIPFFGTLAQITSGTGGDYVRARLRRVLAETVRKEVSALRGFLRWCVEHGHLDEAPEIPNPPRRAVGKRAQKRVQITLTEEQAEAVLAALPERTRRGHPVRAYYTVAWETGLRRCTLRELRIPEHWRRDTVLYLDREVTKERKAREVPITARAQEALEAVAPRRGLIFGTVDYRYALRQAAREVLPAELAEHLSDHDWRHSRLTLWAENGADLLGLQHLAGHRSAATTARYMHAGRRAAEAVLVRVGHRAGTPKSAPAGRRKTGRRAK